MSNIIKLKYRVYIPRIPYNEPIGDLSWINNMERLFDDPRDYLRLVGFVKHQNEPLKENDIMRWSIIRFLKDLVEDTSLIITWLDGTKSRLIYSKNQLRMKPYEFNAYYIPLTVNSNNTIRILISFLSHITENSKIGKIEFHDEYKVVPTIKLNEIRIPEFVTTPALLYRCFNNIAGMIKHETKYKHPSPNSRYQYLMIAINFILWLAKIKPGEHAEVDGCHYDGDYFAIPAFFLGTYSYENHLFDQMDKSLMFLIKRPDVAICNTIDQTFKEALGVPSFNY